MKIKIIRCDFGIDHLLSISYDECRRPRRDAPAADQQLKNTINLPVPPCLGEALRRGPSYIVRFSWFGCEHSVHARFYRAEIYSFLADGYPSRSV